MSAWLVGCLLLLLLLHLLLRRPGKASPRCDAPGPVSLPLIGSCMSVCQPLWLWIESKGRRLYGDVIRVVFPDQVWVVVSGYDELREVFLNENLLGRPESWRKSVGRNSGLALSEGKLWRTHRTFSIRALSDCGWHRQEAQSDICCQAAQLVARIREQLDAGGSAEIDADRMVQASVGAVIAKMVFGCDGFAEDERFFSKLPLVQSQEFHGTRSVLQMLLKRFIRKWPSLRRFLPHRELQEPVLEVLHMCQRRIDQRRCDLRLEEPSAQRDCADYIEFYLREKTNFFSDEENEETDQVQSVDSTGKQLLRDGRLAMTIFDLMTGGIDAVANLVNWSLLLAALHPESQNKLRNEAHGVFGAVAEVDFSQKHRLPYTEAFLEEVQRFVTLLPLGAMRRAVADTKIGGYCIPKGTRVVPNLYGLHHDPKFFPEPHSFQPERFLNEEGSFQTSRYMLAFSLGKRACPGESLARMEAFVIVVSVLMSFSVSLPEADRQRLPSLMKGSNGFVRRVLPHSLLFTELPACSDAAADPVAAAADAATEFQ